MNDERDPLVIETYRLLRIKGRWQKHLIIHATFRRLKKRRFAIWFVIDRVKLFKISGDYETLKKAKMMVEKIAELLASIEFIERTKQPIGNC